MWYYYTNNLEYGPVAESALAELLAKGVITAQTLIRDADQSEWQTVEESELTASIEVPKDNPKVWQSCAFSGERLKRKEMARVNGFWVAKAHRDEAAAFTSKGGWLPTQQSGCRAQGCVDFGHLLRRSWQLFVCCRTSLAWVWFIMLGMIGDKLWQLCNAPKGFFCLPQTAAHLTLLAFLTMVILRAVSSSARMGTSEIDLGSDPQFSLTQLAQLTALFLPLAVPICLGMIFRPTSALAITAIIAATACVGARFAFAPMAMIERQLSPLRALHISMKITAGSIVLWGAAFLALFAVPTIVAIAEPASTQDYRFTVLLFRTLAFLSLIPLFVCYQELEARHLERQEQSSAPHRTT